MMAGCHLTKTFMKQVEEMIFNEPV